MSQLIAFYLLALYSIIIEFCIDRLGWLIGFDYHKQLLAKIKNCRTIRNSSKRPVALLTGADGTIGLEIIRLLISLDFLVIALVRDSDELKGLKHERLKVEPIDLRNLKFVDQLANRLLHDENTHVDLIICNAAVMFHASPDDHDDDGVFSEFDIHFIVNLLSHAILIDRLLKPSDHPQTVVFVSSITAHLGDISRLSLGGKAFFERRSSVYDAYATSKLAIAIYAKQLARHSAQFATRVVSVHPGCVASPRLYKQADLFSRCFVNGWLGALLMRTASVAAAEVVAAGLVDEIQSGYYYQHGKPIELWASTANPTECELFTFVQEIINSNQM